MIHGVVVMVILRSGAILKQGGAIIKILFQKIVGNTTAMSQHAVLIVVAGLLQVMLIAVLIILRTAGKIMTKAHAMQLQIVHGLQVHMAAAAGAEISLMRAHSCLINQS